MRRSESPQRSARCAKLPPPVEREADDRALLLQVVDYYNETLKQSPEAMKYLESRGLKSPEIIDRFQAGLRQSHARLSPAGEEPRRRRGAAWPAAAARHLSAERP